MLLLVFFFNLHTSLLTPQSIQLLTLASVTPRISPVPHFDNLRCLPPVCSSRTCRTSIQSARTCSTRPERTSRTCGTRASPTARCSGIRRWPPSCPWTHWQRRSREPSVKAWTPRPPRSTSESPIWFVNPVTRMRPFP